MCEPVNEVPHPLGTGTIISPGADKVVAYSPRTGELSEYFLGYPAGGGSAAVIGPGDPQPTGFPGADSIATGFSGSLVLYDADTGEFRVVSRDESGVWTIIRQMRGTLGWSHVVPGDYDGDGSTDILFYRSSDGLMRFYSISPTGRFEALTPAMYGTRGWAHIVSGDYDGNGTDDVYWYRSTDGLMRFYEVSISDGFQPLSPAMFGTRNWSSITEGSYVDDASGLVFYRDDGIARFYEVDPVEGFTSTSPALSVGSDYRQVVSGDFDADGIDEVLWYISSGTVISGLASGDLLELSDSTPMPQQMLISSVP